jgi:cytochrome c-type biogenesis protein CcmH/NrfG
MVSLEQALTALHKGDKATAKAILAAVVKREPQNRTAWLLLASALDEPQQIAFCRQQAQLLQPAPSSPPTIPITHSPPADKKIQSPRLRKCPYCAEEIRVEAVICKHCGRNLTKESPEVIAQKRIQLTQKLAELEKNLATWERYFQEQSALAQQAGRQVTWALFGILVGLFLIPVLIGLLLVPAGILAAVTQGAKQSMAQGNQSKARQNIETIRNQIIEVRTQLAALQ